MNRKKHRGRRPRAPWWAWIAPLWLCAACTSPSEWSPAAELGLFPIAPERGAALLQGVHSETPRGERSAQPFTLAIDGDGRWVLRQGASIEFSDGARLRRSPDGKDWRWLDLEEALGRRAEIELGLGAGLQRELPWEGRSTGPQQLDLRRRSGGRSAQAQLADGRIRELLLQPAGDRLRLRPSGALPPTLHCERPDGRLESWTIESRRDLNASEFEQRLAQATTWPSPATDSQGSWQAPEHLLAQVTASGYLLVEPRFEGVSLGPFLVDSAASVPCIDSAVASGLDWNQLGSTEIQGVGGRSHGVWRRSGSMQLGGWQQQGLAFVELDLALLSELAGQPVAGLLGLTAFGDRVVVIDPARARFELYDPRDPALQDWPWQPAPLDHGAPCVRLAFAPDNVGWFRLDTGSNDTVTLHAGIGWEKHFGSRAEFLDLPLVHLNGIGGGTSARRGPLAWIELREKRHSRVPASFVVGDAGPLAASHLAGTLGAGFLGAFRTAIHRNARRVAFLPPGP